MTETLRNRIRNMEAYQTGEPFTVKHVVDSLHVETPRAREAIAAMVDGGMLAQHNTKLQKPRKSILHTRRLANPVEDPERKTWRPCLP